jgi:hypothetical protein
MFVCKQPISWFRFIDDVDMKWTHGDKELDAFLEHANSIHPSIKFIHEVSKTKMSCLDTTTTVKEGNITDKHRLSPHGLHWPTVDEGLDTAALTSVSLMLLGRRNATTGGSGNNLASASEINRNDLLEYKEKKINKRVPLILTYHPSLEKISGIVRHHWKEIEKSERAENINQLSCCPP